MVSMKELKCEFDPIKGILYYKRFAGITTLDEIFEEFNQLINTKKLPKNLKILEDGRENQISFSTKDLDLLIGRLEMVVDDFTSIRHAVVYTDIRNKAYTILIGNMIKTSKYCVEVFSTLEAAEMWIAE
jgi:hypothetical protein